MEVKWENKKNEEILKIDSITVYMASNDRNIEVNMVTKEL